MRISLLSTLTIFLAAALSVAAFAAEVKVPVGTQVQVKLIHSLSSGNATVNEPFSFEAAAPVLASGRTVIAKGALGAGHVVRVSKAQGKSAGHLTLSFDSIHAADGTAVPLSEDSRLKGNSEKGKASTATIAATIALGPLGLFAHNMVKGKDITVSTSQTFPAWVKSTTTVNVH